MSSLSNYPRHFHRIRIGNPKIYMKKKKKAQNCQRNPEETNKTGGITLSDFRQY